jgi:branched-subunit amino acid transport protein
VSWATIFVIAGGAYLLKVSGLVLLRGWQPPTVVQRCLDLLPAALIAALIVVNTVVTGRHLVADARLVGVSAAAVAAWRKLPFPVVVLLGAGVTALMRRLG